MYKIIRGCTEEKNRGSICVKLRASVFVLIRIPSWFLCFGSGERLLLLHRIH